MPAKSKVPASPEITILEISQGRASFCVLGTSPLIYNQVAAKGLHEFLFPKGRKTSADRAADLKHDPLSEYRNSVYRFDDDAKATRLCAPTSWFNAAIMTAALRMPGATKTEIGQLTWPEVDKVEVFGVPELFMSVVRSADMARTPDVRTRAIVPQWCCKVDINFIRPQITDETMKRLMATAGLICGVGDFRQEKGKGSYGQFRLVNATDQDFVRLAQKAGRKAQDASLQAGPLAVKCYDHLSDELFSWFNEELKRRGKSTSPSKGRSAPEAHEAAE